jgi:hypothetical protein
MKKKPCESKLNWVKILSTISVNDRYYFKEAEIKLSPREVLEYYLLYST